MNARELAQYIDHTLLQPDAFPSQIERLVNDALEYQFRAICVESKWLPLVVPRLAGSQVWPITVISFPAGTDETADKAQNAKAAVSNGAREIDMVLNRTLLSKREYGQVENDIHAVVGAVAVPVKVILETSELTDEQKAIACALSKAAGAAFVKTSTGFTKSGAKEKDVALMRRVVGLEMGVKASGGIRTLADAMKMISAGANRLGCSASVSIIRELSGGKAGGGGGD